MFPEKPPDAKLAITVVVFIVPNNVIQSSPNNPRFGFYKAYGQDQNQH